MIAHIDRIRNRLIFERMCAYPVIWSVLLYLLCCILLSSPIKEGTKMKNTTLKVYRRRYPNTATTRYRISQALDCAVMAAATVGMTVVLLFLMMI